MFGLTIVRKADIKEYQRSHTVHQRVVSCRDWFNEHKELDYIWDYLLLDPYFGDISSARDKYIAARAKGAE